MKILPIFLLFICATLSAQTIDCQLIDQISKSQFNQNRTSRSTILTKSSYGDLETITEIDSEKRRRVKTRPSFGNRKPSDIGGSSQSETLFIDGLFYTKDMIKNTWTYRKNTFHRDSMDMKSKMADVKRKDEACQKTGSETIAGKTYDIIERTRTTQKGSETPETFKNRLWINFTDNTIKKSEVAVEVPNSTMKMVTEYDVEVEPIVKPLNAVESHVSFPLLTSNKQGQGRLGNNKDSLSTRKFPQFKDGTKGLFKYMTDNLVYPQAAKDAKVEGTVYVRFMVDTDGQVSDVTIAKGLRDDMNEAAIELIKKTSGNWRPGSESGKPTKQAFTMPVKFKL
jgi:periplasmic protein TonB